MAAPATARVLNLCGRLSILETAEVIRRSALFIGIDSGPAHLANAVGTPGVILLGDFLGFRRYMPYSGGYKNGTNGRIVYADRTVRNIPADAVLREISHWVRGSGTILAIPDVVENTESGTVE